MNYNVDEVNELAVQEDDELEDDELAVQEDDELEDDELAVQVSLAEVAKHSDDFRSRLGAVSLLTDQTALSEIAGNVEETACIRMDAAAKLKDINASESIYEKIAQDTTAGDANRIRAAQMMKNTALAEEILFEIRGNRYGRERDEDRD